MVMRVKKVFQADVVLMCSSKEVWQNVCVRALGSSTKMKEEA